MLLLCGWGAVAPLRADWSGLIVPAYFNPSGSTAWSRLADAAARVPLIAIANEANGPGTAPSASYRQAITRVQSNGGRVIGYVYTSYGKRSEVEVFADIDRWAAAYPLDGIFVDEMANDGSVATLAYYRGLLQHVQAKYLGWQVMGNPGTTTQEVYLSLPTVDQVVTFEHHSGYPTYSADAWTRKYPAQAFAHLGYQVPDIATVTNYLALSRKRNAAWIYFTDDQLPNPWDQLPTYWDDEVALVREANREEPLLVTNMPAEVGLVSLTITSIPGLHTIESSVDLIHWAEFYQAGISNGRMSLTFTTVGAEARFYRVRR